MANVKTTIKDGVLVIKNKAAFDKLVKEDNKAAREQLRKDSGAFHQEVQIGKQKYKILGQFKEELFTGRNSALLPKGYAAIILFHIQWNNEVTRTDFNDWYFFGRADFNKATFTNKTDFNKATFTHKIELSCTNLCGANFNGALFKEAILTGTDLTGAKLSGVNLTEVNLAQADLSNANLTRANLIGANLTRATLSPANLSGANFTGANLSEANLSGANLTEANLSKANLVRAKLEGADLSKAKLEGANLSKAKLGGANLSKVALQGGNLNMAQADLRQANLTNADLSRADLSRADLTRANLTGANLSQTKLFRADLSKASLSEANLTRAYLCEAELDGARFDSTICLDCSFLHTNIGKAVLINVKWHREDKWYRHNRNMIYNEIRAKNDKSTPADEYEYIAEIYRQLKVNYEDKRDFIEAGDFGYGQMEMKRKSLTGFTKAFCSLYKWFSGYGEMPGLAAVWLLFFLLLFPLAYMFNGITPKSPTSKLTKIHYDLSLALPGFGEAVDDFGGAFVHTLQVATIQKDKAYQSCDHPGRGLEILEVILFPVQLTLLVLAMKRKFRR